MLRDRKVRKSGQAQGSATPPSIPDKLYFRIGEVSELARTKPYVLRYWETEFPTLKPRKGPSGHRLYRRQDVEMVVEIRRLLYDEGFTIEGARKFLAGSSSVRETQPSVPSGIDGKRLQTIKRGLEDILTIISRRC
jgi:DNA-binding transcriptional MerR regulator